MKRILSIALSVCMLAATVACAQGNAGTYTATVDGHNGPLSVSVTFGDAGMETIDVVAHAETPGISDGAISLIPEKILAGQTLNVDLVSGATVTSKAIVEAVKDCAQQAGADIDTLMVAEDAAGEVRLTAGTYEAISRGHHGNMKVAVDVTEDAITDIRVLEHVETYNLATPALEGIPAAIIEHQSTNVDAVTGATYTSRAICTAVANCLEQAGGNKAVIAFSAAVEKEPVAKTSQTIDCDVVVAGAGLTGISAALAAQDEGANVVLVEKLDYFGGISQTAYGFSIVPADDGKDVEDFIRYRMYQTAGIFQGDTYMENDILNVKQIEAFGNQAYDSMAWLESKGAQTYRGLMPRGLYDGSEPCQLTVVGFRYKDHKAPDIMGGVLEDLVNVFKANGGTVLLSTEAQHVLVDDQGKVCGLKAASDAVDYTFNCRSVVLATGGFGASEEMVAQYSPAYKGEENVTLVSNTGDAIKMGLEVGADVHRNGFMMGGSGHTYMSDVDMMHPYSDAVTPKTSIYVNPMGLRVNSEDPDSYTAGTTYVNPDAQDYYWAIINQEQAEVTGYIDVINAQMEAGNPDFHKADDLIALANQINMNANTLTYSVNRYNKLCEAGEDRDMHKNPQYLVAMKEGPWYAAKATMIYFGTVGGLKTNENAAVLRPDGSVIPGLYAAGESSNGGFFNMSYSGAWSISVCHTMGQIAGMNAAK